MSPRICSCTLCASVIADVPGNVSWSNQFRGLSSSPKGIILTGVGLYDDPARGAFIAPVDPNGRWDDSTYESPEEDRFGAMSQGEVNGRHGFVFHEACWDLLEKAFHPRKVLLSRLFDICSSLPFPMNGVSIGWGHDYGGPVLVDHEHHFPWEEDRSADREYLEPDPVLNANPFEVPEVQHILTEAPELPPSSTLSVSITVTPGRDPFHILPGEIRSVIAMNLPTPDFLNLRLASRVFWTVFDSQQFWASRFRDVSDRSWLFEARDGAQPPRDWRWLYRRTNDARIGPGLRNRVRIWNLAQKIVEILGFRWVDTGVASSPKPESSRWVHLAADIWEQPAGSAYSLFDRGCRLFHKHRIAIVDDLTRLSVSCIQVGDTKYVAGLKLATAAGNTRRQVGYWSTREQSVEISEIRGFRAAVGSRGVQALQCITGASDTQHWIGSPEGSPKTQRLGVDGRVTELEVGFDGCKMVSLAVCRQLSLPEQADRDHEKDRLRNSGFWYPDIPGPALCLNEESFAPRDHYLSGYKPLFWTTFGGPGGVHLRNLTGLTAIWGGGGLRRVDFAYDVPVPSEHRTFGCQKPGEWTKTIEFAIDGPGGELIDTIEVFRRYPDAGYPWLVEEGTLVAFRRPHDGSGITTLGVISEIIEGK
ncbi:hypothetical protein CTA1_11015 [Colletotrichum tanaceti]|uniref:F-box domain-containing protein n=1 Tax=Colletotrichum tanaceti TaxID=1306861 RepID=A0A4U6X1A6_9PEZI|nr:hypothetical protein CTA1_11015 [Colletotrichum tanaceti]